MSQSPSQKSTPRQSTLPTPSPALAPSTPRPAPWKRDGVWILNDEGRPVCMLLQNNVESTRLLLLAAGDTAWQRDELLARLRDVATAPGLEGPVVEAARALLTELDKDAT